MEFHLLSLVAQKLHTSPLNNNSNYTLYQWHNNFNATSTYLRDLRQLLIRDHMEYYTSAINIIF